MTDPLKNTLIIMCGGSGSRFGSHEPKALVRPYWLGGESVLTRLLSQANALFEQVVIVVPTSARHLYEAELNRVNEAALTYRMRVHAIAEPQGTGHALLSVLKTMTTHDDVTVIWGDVILREPMPLAMLAYSDMRTAMMLPVFKHADNSVPYVEIVRDKNGYVIDVLFDGDTHAGGYQDMCMFRFSRSLILDILHETYVNRKILNIQSEFNLLTMAPKLYSTRWPATTYECTAERQMVRSFNTYEELERINEWLHATK